MNVRWVSWTCIYVHVPVCCTRTNGCLDQFDQLEEGNLLKRDYILVGGFLSSPLSLSLARLSNPLLLPSAVDVVDGRSHCPFLVFLVRVRVGPLQWLGDGVILHGAVAVSGGVRLFARDQLHGRADACGDGDNHICIFTYIYMYCVSLEMIKYAHPSARVHSHMQ